MKPVVGQWMKGKPDVPGRYRTRWPSGQCEHMVTVRRWGRGLQVVPDPPYPSEPMSIIGEDEVEWMLMPNDRPHAEAVADSVRAEVGNSEGGQDGR